MENELRGRLKLGWLSILLALLAYVTMSLVHQYYYEVHDIYLLPAGAPRIERMLLAAASFLVSQEIIQAFSLSVQRVLVGLLIGFSIGTAIGFLMGWSERIEDHVNPLYNLLRPIPPIAGLALFLLWFGIKPWTLILLTAYGVALQSIIPAYHGVRDVPAVYVQTAKILGVGKRVLFTKVLLPAASPRILAGLRISIFAAWTITVAGEMLTSAWSGIGFLLTSMTKHYRPGIAFLDIGVLAVLIMFLGFLGFLMDLTARFATRRLTSWMKREEK